MVNLRTPDRRTSLRALWRCLAATALLLVTACHGGGPATVASPPPAPQTYGFEDTRALVEIVNDAARLVRDHGEAAFAELCAPGSRFRRQETYVFVLDPEGNMLVHPDPALEGKNELGLLDVNGKPIVRGLIDAATALPSKSEGWYHYEWPMPGGLLPRWKSSFVRLVTAPSGKRYVVGSGVYDDRMEKTFVVDLVKDAAGEIQRSGAAAFDRLRDPKGRFMAKDAYVFVVAQSGVEVVNPAFRNLEGRNVADVKDARGKPFVREMLQVGETTGSGWVEYMWPKPGESAPTQKSTYVMRVNLPDGGWLLVACGVYLADAPKGAPLTTMTAPQLMTLVHEGAVLLATRGEDAYAELGRKGSKWFGDDTYFFVWTLDGTRTFHAADPSLVGSNAAAATDSIGRPYGRMFLDVAATPSGRGWVHYMYPEPGNIFPVWKSVFLERVTLPTGEKRLIGCGVYNMKLDRTMIADVVDHAAALVAERGADAFPLLRDKRGPFVFMDTYVFVDSPQGLELVNAAQPFLEGKNVAQLRDAKGKAAAEEYIAAAMKQGSAWVDYDWYRPGSNAIAKKHTLVRKVQSPQGVYVVGSGLYGD